MYASQAPRIPSVNTVGKKVDSKNTRIRGASPASPRAPVATAWERVTLVKTNKTNRGLTHIENVSRNLPMVNQPWATAWKFAPAVADVFRRVSVK